jgi:predicted RNA binding protein YcfA (HicA-like mRNA interferase family)
MKPPRGVAGDRVIRVLESLGCAAVRQKGSHVRLRNEGPPAHAITLPRHDPLKVGTLHDIPSEVAMTVESLIDRL